MATDIMLTRVTPEAVKTPAGLERRGWRGQ